MKEFNSFEKYAEELLYNDIYSKVSGYVYHNKDRMDLSTYEVHDPDYVKLEDFKVYSTLFSDAPGYQLLFDLVCIADITIKGRGKYDYEADNKEQWFLVSCEGILKDGLQRARVTKVDIYSKKKFEADKRLSRKLIPYICAKNLNDVADDFLKRYCPEALQKPMMLPLEDIVKRMGLEMKQVHITKNCDIFGQIYFADTDISIYDKEKESYVPMHIKEKTILVDPDVFFMRCLGSLNNTIIHECVHWDKHKRYFELQKLYRSNVSAISCHVVEGVQTEEKRSDLQWMEWQANALAPRILMPARTTKAKIEQLLVQLHVEYSRLSEADIMEMVIMELSEFFGVSIFAAKLRAMDLGYDQAVGVLNYYDYRYLPNYSFKQGSLKKNQTFVIKIQDVLCEKVFNQTFNQLVSDGKFVYVNSMFCINDSKYITRDEDGNAKFTDYARDHVDECCLKFDITKRVNTRYGMKFYRECYLCHDIIADTFTETKYVDTTDSQDKIKRSEELRKLKNETGKLQRIQKEIPPTFPEALKYHMKRRNYTVEGLASDSLIGPRTIQSLRNDENYPYSIPLVAALCLGMHLHPQFSDDLLEKAGLKLTKTNEQHIVYRFLLDNCYKASIHECNEVLQEYDMPLMGTEIK